MAEMNYEIKENILTLPKKKRDGRVPHGAELDQLVWQRTEA